MTELCPVEFRPGSLTEELFAEQRDLSAVARFARWQSRPGMPADPVRYRDLIPMTEPAVDQQYSFEVDLDRCTGCKACVSACHSLNGLDEGEAWRNVGLLVSDDWRQPFQQTVTAACHHCVDPACLNGCPVLAYDKDPRTGIVRHLDDQCIGCQYCVLMCPYDVPKYSERRGIVRKCDMCHNRLAAGEPPACAQACPTEAIQIAVVDMAAVTARYRGGEPGAESGENGSVSQTRNGAEVGRVVHDNDYLVASPDPSITLPTTRYKTARKLPAALRAADREEVGLQPAHTPLVFMLVLSQLAVGLFVVASLTAVIGPGGVPVSFVAAQTFAGLIIGMGALGIGGAHLGRPLGAWRCFLGLRRSWLSREVVVFGVFMGLAAASAAASGHPLMPIPVSMEASSPPHLRIETSLLLWTTTLCGLFAVFCSAMVYHDTRREFWRLSWTLGKFFGSTALLGAGGALLFASILVEFAPDLVLTLSATMLVASTFKLGVEHRALRHLWDEDFSPLHKTALLLTGQFGPLNRCRIACGIVGGVVLPVSIMLGVLSTPVLRPDLFVAQAAFAFLLLLAGDLIERRLFFTSVQPQRMPGAIRA